MQETLDTKFKVTESDLVEDLEKGVELIKNKDEWHDSRQMKQCTPLHSKRNTRKLNEERKVINWLTDGTLEYNLMSDSSYCTKKAHELGMSVGRLTSAFQRTLILDKTGWSNIVQNTNETNELAKGKNRNKPCPCESGKKIKNCCGK